ncbi:MAG TPA: zinc ribbon domain-containing protein [Pyrinomonadaceae bacterium]
MFCPGCGSSNSTDQRFCRRCGINLEPFVQSLLEQLPAGRPDDLAQREQRLERFGRFAFGGFGIVLLIAMAGIIYTVFTRMVLDGQQPWVGILLISFIIFAAMALTYVVFAEDLKERRKKAGRAAAPESPTPELEGPTPTARLLEESRFEPASSVVENTTELLPSRRREL